MSNKCTGDHLVKYLKTTDGSQTCSYLGVLGTKRSRAFIYTVTSECCPIGCPSYKIMELIADLAVLTVEKLLSFCKRKLSRKFVTSKGFGPKGRIPFFRAY